jgi:hypothetical protein
VTRPRTAGRFEHLVEEYLAPALTQRGLRRHRQTFMRRRPEAWQVVTLDCAKWSRPSRPEFVVELAVALDVLGGDAAWRDRGWPLCWSSALGEVRVRRKAHGVRHPRPRWTGTRQGRDRVECRVPVARRRQVDTRRRGV